MEFADTYLTAGEYFDILQSAWEQSAYFDGWDQKWHPEDLYNNFESVFNGVSAGLIQYMNVLVQRFHEDKKKTVPVFGGTLPADYNSDKKTVEDMKLQQAGVSGFFGDNV